ncbi:acyl-CoA reductase [Clostridium chromiireducens]|uniref:Acyl-CoA reductase (LuxC) n=1 Tax=Clostridium chromiireducens TaxID=225345 RepID=A0A1V4ICP9_9CLOT|nr:acyl-CoA reductase [Clostridium chromiireducens]OPJ57751.1 acyl-CoA reductase (LuxC) [Clostridium chromiireducens]
MISCYMLGDKFFTEPKKYQNFDEIIEELNKNREAIYSYPSGAIVEIINKYSKILSSDRKFLNYEGVPFLALWLKKSNIIKLLCLDLNKQEYLDDFIQIEDNKFMKAQPMGVVCHFMAGNVPTLPIYYLIQALLCKNINICRVPLESIRIVSELLKPLLDIKVNYNSMEYNGITLLKSISIINFSRDNIELNTEMSKVADVRVICGGEKAVNSLSTLHKKTTCKDIIFGPKYSFAVFEKSAMESLNLSKTFDDFAKDIISFDQKACSSPQVLFIEKSNVTLKEAALKLSKSLERVLKRYPETEINQGTSANIINKRGEYLLSPEKDIICSRDLQYTILIDKDIALEEPIQHRTIFLKEVEDIFEVCKLVTPRVQTIGIASEDNNKIINFANKVSLNGVDRLVRVGFMNLYDSPWDGMLFINQIVKWTVLNLN